MFYRINEHIITAILIMQCTSFILRGVEAVALVVNHRTHPIDYVNLVILCGLIYIGDNGIGLDSILH